MKIIVIGEWSSTITGNVQDGEILDLDDFLADQFITRGLAKSFKEVSVEVAKKLDAGQVSDAGSSQAAQAAPRRGRPAKSKAEAK
jgi:hypothetical protein